MSTRKRGPYGPYSPEETRQKLIDVALELFRARGYQGTSVQMIAQRSQLTKGAFYHHFESKDDLLRQIHYVYASRVVETVREISLADLGPVEKLREVIRGVVFTFAQYRSHVAIFYQEFRYLTGTAYSSIKDMHDEEEYLVIAMIQAGKNQGVINAGTDPKLLLLAISGITAWIYQWYDPEGSLSIEEIADGLADIILLGAIPRENESTASLPVGAIAGSKALKSSSLGPTG